MRTTTDMRTRTQSAMHLHPEFGYFCPSFRLRGRIRLAAVLVAFGALLGGSVLLVTLDGRSADASDRTIATLDDGPSAQELASLPIPAEAAAKANTDANRGAGRNRVACEDFAGSFLDRSCRQSEPRKRHAQRRDHRVATALIGRADAQPAASDTDNTPAQSASTTIASGEPVPLPIKRPNIVAAKPKIAQTRDSRPTSKDTTISAYAPSAELEERNTRPTDFPLAFGGLFGLH
jgi:hypothetical protein